VIEYNGTTNKFPRNLHGKKIYKKIEYQITISVDQEKLHAKIKCQLLLSMVKSFKSGIEDTVH
jgi:hypothetical protein